MSKKLTDIQGIGPSYAEKLAEIGLTTQEQLLADGKTPKGRAEIAEKSGISSKLVLGWINRADLARIKGVGEEYADLLEHAGVDTVPELAQRNASNLHKKMSEVNEAKNLVRSLPSEKMVTGWVEQAKELPRAIEY
jgi:predicted flap endonuclease-1-like 5' DNA nuclease